MKKFLIYYNFIIVSALVISGFLGASNLSQLVAAILFYPMLAYFMIRVIPRRNKAINLPQIVASDSQPTEILELQKDGVDTDRRAFLKLIGTAGLSLFMFAMFTKRAEAAFFGSVPGPGTVSIKDSSGVKIDPAEKKPTDGYNITDIDDSSPAYYGFLNKSGAWFIQKEGTSGDYRYAKGASNYSTNWTNRASLTYDYFDSIF